ncbi:hypothetical protein [Sporolituus thermophilus]|uniref:Uncharacterized protein n=1 Tax=Sporolituus thermophilus DSM 23256 TaxID=1123285 RepID=A0A1G7MDA1_9FIRM|nr:hypothetical protein [Sporolituus thermophilus]SDF59635.1 hypothetical protein SAMN05660235_02111 [Sporolituus thermophilus DSM 23256]
METVCPLCNGMADIDQRCPRCGGKMVDGGALENYLGPYSPYLDVDSFNYGLPNKQCVHLLFCPACGYDSRTATSLVTI